MGGEPGLAANHPSGEELIAFAAGDVVDASGRSITEHLAGCAECAAAVARYRLARDVIRANDGYTPPLALVTRVKALIAPASPEAPPAGAPGLLQPLRRVIADLVFDSGAGLSPSLAGFRGGGERHLTYVAEAVQIDLRLRPPERQGDAWRVQGQVDAEKLIPATAIDLASAGEERTIARATTDEHGMFDLAAPAGRYDLLIRLPCAVQVLPGLVLG